MAKFNKKQLLYIQKSIIHVKPLGSCHLINSKLIFCFVVDSFLEKKDDLPLKEQLRILLEKMDMASQSSKFQPFF